VGFITTLESHVKEAKSIGENVHLQIETFKLLKMNFQLPWRVRNRIKSRGMYGGHISNSQQVDRAIECAFRSQGEGREGPLPMSEGIREVKPTNQLR
jgi:hypothetical protein